MRWLGLSLAILLPAAPAPARTWFVASDGSGDAPTLQAAVDSAAVGDSILLGDGIHAGPGNRNVLVATDSLLIASASGDPAGCTIDAEGSAGDPRFAIELLGPGHVLEGITVTGAVAQYGAVHARSGLTVRRCVFRGNRATQSGGAIHFHDNSSPRGGDRGTRIIRVEECVFEENSTDGRGGALSLEDYLDAEILDSRFVRNTAGLEGGAVEMHSVTALLSGCVFLGNTATTRGGSLRLWVSGTHATVESCTFHGGGSPEGGHLSVDGATVALDRAILSGAEAGSSIAASGPGVELACCDLWGNLPEDWPPVIAAQLGVEGNFSLDPDFCDPEADDLTLREDSPCADPAPPCGLIGALPVGCQPSRVEPAGWSRVKAAHRHGRR